MNQNFRAANISEVRNKSCRDCGFTIFLKDHIWYDRAECLPEQRHNCPRFQPSYKRYPDNNDIAEQIQVLQKAVANVAGNTNSKLDQILQLLKNTRMTA